jgi:hypothetical protein
MLGNRSGQKESRVTEMTNVNRSSVAGRSTTAIAWWAWVLAAAAFVFFLVFFNTYVPRQHDAPPRMVSAIVGVVVAIVFAGWMLLVGYVHNDAARRGMNKWLWTAIVLFVPNAIGFILYLLTRKQLLTDCANCGYLIQPTYRFCPKCAAPRLAACGHCNTPIQPGDLYCNNCGKILHEPMK